MARGDYVKVTYRTGAGTESTTIQARTAGSSVAVSGTDARSEFVTVEELDKTGRNAIRTARFAKGEVVAIIEGHKKTVIIEDA